MAEDRRKNARDYTAEIRKQRDLLKEMDGRTKDNSETIQQTINNLVAEKKLKKKIRESIEINKGRKTSFINREGRYERMKNKSIKVSLQDYNL